MQDDILKLAYEVSRVTEEKVELIDSVMRQTNLLALNARIEAARAGASGAAFSIVAQEMGGVAAEITRISKELRGAISANIGKLEAIGAELLIATRGARYADLALNAVEIIDRNLYERSCDVRWWATDSAVVDVLQEPSQQSVALASSRLATILRSYTVYLDLWVADASGHVVANGRPHDYPGAVGLNVSHTDWFRRAMRTESGDDFAVVDIERNRALGDAAVAAYSTAVRMHGETNSPAIGALGIFFDWRPQAQTIVEGVGITAEEKKSTRALLLDASHRVIAASDGKGLLEEIYPLKTKGRERGFYAESDRIIGFAHTPGYETYKGLGWYGVLEWKGVAGAASMAA